MSQYSQSPQRNIYYQNDHVPVTMAMHKHFHNNKRKTVPASAYYLNTTIPFSQSAVNA